MGLFNDIYNGLSGFVGSTVQAGIVHRLAEENKKNGNGNENRYEGVITNPTVGVVLTWIEYKPVIGDLLKSLGGKRELLYKILASGGNKTDKLLELPTELLLDDPLSRLVSGFTLYQLYSQLLHPPQTYLGNKFQFRSADGSNNNMLFPQLGQAGTPYAKSVPNISTIHGSQPDPGDLFDLLLGRDETSEEEMRESNLGISSMLLYHATVIIHDIFRTNVGDKNISDTSSYLDLSPLYGRDAESQKTVRQFNRGLLKPDTFAEERLLNQPVGVCIYLIMYNRFHNYVAQQLLEINENGKFLKPPAKKPDGWSPSANWQPPKTWKPAGSGSNTEWPEYRDKLDEAAKFDLWRKAAEEKLDEDLFQTARLITCGMYINISIHDYLRVLTRVHLKNTPWTLDPRKEVPLAVIDPRGMQRGQGNQVSVEFNVLYRFHSPLSRRDVKWTSDFLKDLLKDFVGATKGPSLTKEELANYNIPIPVMGAALKKMYAKLGLLNNRETLEYFPEGLSPNFGQDSVEYRFKRDPTTHKFDDKELAKEMVKVMEDPTCEFGAKNTARMFRSIEILGILQARKWELASLNEFRSFFGLSVHKTFEDINDDPIVAKNLQAIYRHPDQVELYPGLVCEGQGRCLDPGTKGPKEQGTALWRAVFSDAVTLVRSDRFYTTDWNVGSLTGWGMREVTSIPEVMKGSVMHRLFHRAFPGFFPYNSLHLWQPFHIPAINYVLAQNQGLSRDLENLDEMGLDEKIVSTIKDMSEKFNSKLIELKEKLKKVEPQDLLKSLAKETDAKKPDTLGNLENNNEVGYTKLEIVQIKEAIKKKDGEFAQLQLMFKPLKRAIRMPDSKFNSETIAVVHVTSYDTIVKQILTEPSIFKNPGYLDSQSISNETLRAILTGKLGKEQGVKLQAAATKLGKMIQQKEEDCFMEYFAEKTEACLNKKSRQYQKVDVPGKNEKAQVYQIDVVSDVAAPVVAQFVGDFLGFWDWKPPEKYQEAKDQQAKDEPANYATVYQHLKNCQDYLTYNSDKLSVFPRRIEFRRSIDWLSDASIHGVNQVKGGERNNTANTALQKFGNDMATALLKMKLTVDEAAAIRLSIVLDAVHKSVLMFTEVLNYLLHTKTGNNSLLWADVKAVAQKDGIKSLSGYILEAQRLACHVPLVREVADDVTELPKIKPSDGSEAVTIQKGTVLLLDVDEAQQDPTHFEAPQTFNPNRKSQEHLIYGREPGKPCTAKHITIIALSAMIKEIAKLDYLRRAHNTEGRINKAKTPDGVERYLTQEFDQLVPFPTTWQLRYNGEGNNVYQGPDNSDVGDGMENVYQDGQLSAEGGSLKS